METNKDWSNLPVHKPDVDLWERIDTELDLERVSGNLDTLPGHSPKQNLWNSISQKLTYNQYLNYFYVAGIGIVAAILFIILTNTDTKTIEPKPNRNIFNQLPFNQKDINIEKEKSKPTLLTETNRNSSKPFPEISTKAKNGNKSVYSRPVTLTDAQNYDKALYSSDKEINENQFIAQNKTVNQQFIKNAEIAANSSGKVFQNEIQPNNNSATDKSFKNQNDNKIENSELKNNVLNEKIALDSTENRIESVKNDVDESDTRKVNLKSTNEPAKKGIYTIGIDYTFNKIYNRDKFSYSDNKTLGQYGITLKYSYSKLFFQTGVNYSKFTDRFNYNSDQKLNQFTTYNYVDSVIYNSQGVIIQYITHPVTINDSILFRQLINVSKNYALLNVPIIVGYQWNYRKFSVSLKAGILYSLVISEKENMILPENPNISVIKIYSETTSIRKTNWAGIVSAEIDYQINRRWGVSVEPVLQYYFKPQYQEMDKNSTTNTLKPYLIGLKTGLYFKF